MTNQNLSHFVVGEQVKDERSGRNAVVLQVADTYMDRNGKPRPRPMPVYQIQYESGSVRWVTTARLDKKGN